MTARALARYEGQLMPRRAGLLRVVVAVALLVIVAVCLALTVAHAAQVDSIAHPQVSVVSFTRDEVARLRLDRL
jgi:ABC-type anion transport system duplicated permease subunit